MKKEHQKNKWLETFSMVNDLLIKAEIKHVFIKMLINPFAMSDIDVLIPIPSEELMALELLQKEGFTLMKDGGLFTHPLKFVCEKKGSIGIDIHPDIEWGRTKVGDAMKVIKRSIVEKLYGVKARIPAPDDSFYIIGTHAVIQHRMIRREEVLNASRLISHPKYSWERVKEMTEDYGTISPIYAFLRAIKLEYPQSIGQDILKNFSNFWASKMIEGLKLENFPCYIPPWIEVISSFTHTPKLFGKAKLKEIVIDFLSHYVRIRELKGR